MNPAIQNFISEYLAQLAPEKTLMCWDDKFIFQLPTFLEDVPTDEKRFYGYTDDPMLLEFKPVLSPGGMDEFVCYAPDIPEYEDLDAIVISSRYAARVQDRMMACLEAGGVVIIVGPWDELPPQCLGVMESCGIHLQDEIHFFSRSEYCVDLFTELWNVHKRV